MNWPCKPQGNKIRKRVSPSSYVRNEKVQPCLLSTSRMKTRPMPCPHLAADARPVVHHLHGSRGGGAHHDFSSATAAGQGDALCCVLDDVHQHLFKQRGIHLHLPHLPVALQAEGYPRIGTHALHEALTPGSHLVQGQRHERRFGNLHHVGETGDEAAHRVATACPTVSSVEVMPAVVLFTSCAIMRMTFS